MSQHLPIESLAIECKKIIDGATKALGEKHIKGMEFTLVMDNLDYADSDDLRKALEYPLRETAFADDWLILAKDATGKLHCVSTELWEEWIDLPKDADQEKGAVAKYMLPIALKKWENLSWRKCEE